MQPDPTAFIADFREHVANGEPLTEQLREQLVAFAQGPPPKPLSEGASRRRHGQGSYRRLRRPDHPLADSNGIVPEHRLVLYEKIGPGAHPCHWCARTVYWNGEPALVADHLNFLHDDNRPDNLVPACSPCNHQRMPDLKWTRKRARAEKARSR